MEGKHKEELDTLKEEKENLQGLVTRQTYIIQELEKQLNRATTNNSVLQKQQLELMDTVHNLVNLCTKEGSKNFFLTLVLVNILFNIEQVNIQYNFLSCIDGQYRSRKRTLFLEAFNEVCTDNFLMFLTSEKFFISFNS